MKRGDSADQSRNQTLLKTISPALMCLVDAALDAALDAAGIPRDVVPVEEFSTAATAW